MNNLIIMAVVVAAGVIVGAMGYQNYQDVSHVRDQGILRAALDDCRRLFDAGPELDGCLGRSYDAFGTSEQKSQWELGYPGP